jgi:hypothetical protein
MSKYIDNKKFFVEITKYVEVYNLREKEGKELPRLTEYLGDCFLKIATNLALKYNFASYKFKDEMISDGYFDCIRYAHKFDETKTKNPFAYFTQICWYAFIRKIQKEKKVLYTKYKAINNSELFGLLHTHADADDLSIINDIGYSEGARENMDNFIREYEAKHPKG